MDGNDLETISLLARKLTRYETDVSVLKSELMDQYPPLSLLIEKSLRYANKRGTLMIPELRFDGNESIGIFSDYSGEDSASLFQTYSILVFGWNHAYTLMDDIEQSRIQYGLNSSTEISYKNLRRGQIGRYLPEYLKSCNYIAGMLFTLAIHKNVGTAFGNFEKTTANPLSSILRDSDFGDRKEKIAEKLLRIIHLSAYLTGWLSREGQKLFWLSDDDAIVPNEEKTRQTLNLFQNVLSIYSEHNYGTIGYATPSGMESRGNLLNFLSVTDLAAGALEGYLTRRERGTLPSLKREAKVILEWLRHSGIGLKKHTIVIELNDKKGWVCSELTPKSIKKRQMTRL